MKTIKVLAGSLAAITAGATLALGIFAAPITSLGDYVKVSGSALNSPTIVIGDTGTVAAGYALDVVGAADIAAAVAGYATTTVSTGAVGMGVSGGAEIGTTNTKLYLGDVLTKSGVKSTMTKNDLSTLLASGTITDTSGTNYIYDQYINLGGGTAVGFGTSGGDLTDPDLVLNLSSTAASPVYNYTVTFNKLLNISSSNVQNKKIKLLGVDYTIGSTSACASANCGGATDQLVLYGSSLVQTMAGGEEKKVTVGSTEYTVKFIGASSGTTAYVSVNGNSQSVTKGQQVTIEGLPVYVEDIFYISSTDTTQNSVKLSFGTNKLTLKDGQTVKKGTSDDTIDGTLVKLTGTANSGLSKIDIAVAAKDASHDYVRQGADAAFVDPVFSAFKLAFGGVSGGTTEKITVDNSGTTAATLKFTDYRGNERSLTYAYSGSTTFGADLNSTSTATFVVIENQTVKLNDYVLLTPSQESEFSHVMQYTTASSLGSSGAYVELKDVMSDTTSRMYLSEAGYGTGTFYIDGQAYYAANVSNTLQTFRFTWGDSTAGIGLAGAKVTVFPLVKTSLGGWVTLAGGNRSAVVTNAVNWITKNGDTVLELPGGDVTVSTTADNTNITCGSTAVTAGGISTTGTVCAPGRLAFNVTVKNNTAVYVTPNMGNGDAAAPVVIFREEKAKNLANTDVQDFVVVSVADGSGSGVDLTVSAPNLTAAVIASGGLQSDNSVTMYGDRRGTFVKFDSDSQGLIEITYPDEQSVATVAVGASPTFGAGAAGSVQAAVKITSPVAKIASEVSTTAPGSDLILVGGPCANSLVAKLLAPAVTCDNWNYTTGIIQEVTGGFSDGSRALIVAGTKAVDTRALAAKVISGTLSYSA